jgi:hypothetical protein
MNKSASSAFINQLLACSLGMLVFTGSIGFGTVWLRHQISLAANRNKDLQVHLNEVQRRLDEVTAEIASMQSPDALIRLDSSMRLGLDTPREEQIVYVTANPELELAAKRNASVFVAEVQPVLLRRAGTR